MPNTLPTTPGLYWAKTAKNFKWWNLIIKVGGSAPWLRIDYCLDRGNIHLTHEVSIEYIIWGPPLVEPPQPTTSEEPQ